MDTLLQAVNDVATLMGRAALPYYRGAPDLRAKADGSPVTDADLAAERAAREWLARHFKDDAIVGEEFGGAAPARGRCWYLDPIDGTRTFVRGVPLWGSLAGVVEDGRVIAGAASFPALGERIAAARGLGAWHDDSRARVSSIARLEDAALLTTSAFAADPGLRGRFEELAARAGLTRTWGDCYGYLLVATGRAEVMFDAALSPWDAAAVSIVVEEAGGRYTDAAGRAGIFGASGLATNAALADEIRAALRRPTGTAAPGNVRPARTGARRRT